jgi:hypothetical protein
MRISVADFHTAARRKSRRLRNNVEQHRDLNIDNRR